MNRRLLLTLFNRLAMGGALYACLPSAWAQPSYKVTATQLQAALAEQTLQDAVLHQLKPQDLALPDGMGLQPGSITVTAEGLVIGFVNKQS